MTIYYRTAKGSHKHISHGCANQRRDIMTGDVSIIPANEVADWTPCEHCCPTGMVAEAAAKAADKAAAMCPNDGVVKPRHIESECRSCGKRGKVDRRTGKLRAHKAA
jgi:hypothetical protein